MIAKLAAWSAGGRRTPEFDYRWRYADSSNSVDVADFLRSRSPLLNNEEFSLLLEPVRSNAILIVRGLKSKRVESTYGSMRTNGFAAGFNDMAEARAVAAALIERPDDCAMVMNEVVSDAPQEAGYGFHVDFERLRQWLGNIASQRKTSIPNCGSKGQRFTGRYDSPADRQEVVHRLRTEPAPDLVLWVLMNRLVDAENIMVDGAPFVCWLVLAGYGVPERKVASSKTTKPGETSSGGSSSSRFSLRRAISEAIKTECDPRKP